MQPLVLIIVCSICAQAIFPDHTRDAFFQLVCGAHSSLAM